MKTERSEWKAIFPDRPDSIYDQYYEYLVFCEYRFRLGSTKPKTRVAYYKAHQVVRGPDRNLVYYRREK